VQQRGVRAVCSGVVQVAVYGVGQVGAVRCGRQVTVVRPWNPTPTVGTHRRYVVASRCKTCTVPPSAQVRQSTSNYSNPTGGGV